MKGGGGDGGSGMRGSVAWGGGVAGAEISSWYIAKDLAMAIDYIGNFAWQLTRTRGTAHRTMNNRDNSFGLDNAGGVSF